jgi:hypothetical protein
VLSWTTWDKTCQSFFDSISAPYPAGEKIKMNAIYAGAITGFILGLVGFIVVRFWILPIRRYHKLKKATVATVQTYCNFLASVHPETASREELKHKRQSLRQLAADLTSTYNDILPSWYRLLLESRSEHPLEASTHLMTLSNIHQQAHALHRADQIRYHLRIKSS